MSIQSTTPITNLSEIPYLQIQALLGNLIFIYSSSSTIGVIVSYTPATGKHFMALAYAAQHQMTITSQEAYVGVRNNTLQLDSIITNGGVGRGDTIRGSMVVGNGTITFDMYMFILAGISPVYATLKGVIY